MYVQFVNQPEVLDLAHRNSYRLFTVTNLQIEDKFQQKNFIKIIFLISPKIRKSFSETKIQTVDNGCYERRLKSSEGSYIRPKVWCIYSVIGENVVVDLLRCFVFINWKKVLKCTYQMNKVDTKNWIFSHAFYSDNTSSNPAEVYNFSVKIVVQRTIINKKRPGMAQLKDFRCCHAVLSEKKRLRLVCTFAYSGSLPIYLLLLHDQDIFLPFPIPLFPVWINYYWVFKNAESTKEASELQRTKNKPKIKEDYLG